MPEPGGKSPNPWIRILHAPPQPRLRLVCFPHAGGTAGFFRTWGSLLPEGVELWAVQYPGRENRISEPLVPEMHALADLIAEQLRGALDGPTVFFGHSMGAAVAYEVLCRLTGEDAGRQVRRLIASGCGAPHRIRAFAGHEGAHLLDDEALVALLKKLGTSGAALLDDEDMREMLLPPIRNDYALIQSYTGAPGCPLAVDIDAFAGRADDAVDEDDLRAWAEVTSGAFAHRHFPGGHFYLAEHPQSTSQAVNAALNAVLDAVPSGENS